MREVPDPSAEEGPPLRDRAVELLGSPPGGSHGGEVGRELFGHVTQERLGGRRLVHVPHHDGIARAGCLPFHVGLIDGRP